MNNTEITTGSTEPTTTKIVAGYYERELGGHTVTIDKLDEGLDAGMWIARANWDAYTYSDPVRTKREALEVADDMLAQRVERLGPRDPVIDRDPAGTYTMTLRKASATIDRIDDPEVHRDMRWVVLSDYGRIVDECYSLADATHSALSHLRATYPRA